MNTAYLGLGSNIDAERHLRAAVAALREAYAQVELSPVYRSRAVGFEGADFLNLAARIQTPGSAEDLQAFLRDLEDRHGRRRDVPKFSDRTLDIDILLFGDRRIDRPGLEVPRPEILRFAHVLKPLADLAPDLVHPARGKTLAELWREFPASDPGLEEVDAGFLESA